MVISVCGAPKLPEEADSLLVWQLLPQIQEASRLASVNQSTPCDFVLSFLHRHLLVSAQFKGEKCSDKSRSLSFETIILWPSQSIWKHLFCSWEKSWKFLTWSLSDKSWCSLCFLLWSWSPVWQKHQLLVKRRTFSFPGTMSVESKPIRSRLVSNNLAFYLEWNVDLLFYILGGQLETAKCRSLSVIYNFGLYFLRMFCNRSTSFLAFL